MFIPTLITGLNRLLADAPWARERLQPFAGRTALLRLPPLDLALQVESDGSFSVGDSAEADVTLELSPASLPKIVQGMDALMDDIRITGNANLADTLGFVLRNLRWDGEEALARIVGDIAAHRIFGGLREFGAWQRKTARNVVENLAEYLSEEQPVLVKRFALEEHAQRVSRLRDDLARLEKRLGRLESGKSA
jgi:ubiquinone biosynthesis protein UbiJ